jgi:hypothetical protein
MLAAEAAFAALHPSARFVSTASPATFKLGVSSWLPLVYGHLIFVTGKSDRVED